MWLAKVQFEVTLLLSASFTVTVTVPVGGNQIQVSGTASVDANGTVTIKSKDGDMAVYRVSMIDKITKELKDADFTRDRGFHLTVEAETLNPWSIDEPRIPL